MQLFSCGTSPCAPPQEMSSREAAPIALQHMMVKLAVKLLKSSAGDNEGPEASLWYQMAAKTCVIARTPRNPLDQT